MSLRMTEEEYQEWLRKRGAEKNATAKAAAKQTEAERRDEAEKWYRDAANIENGMLQEVPKKRKSKYNNKRTTVNGMTFDSKHEAQVYQELMLRKNAGELRCVLRQAAFDLPGGIKYIADFVTIAPDMSVEGIYDAKSEATKKDKVYIIKKKLMKEAWGLDIKEV